MNTKLAEFFTSISKYLSVGSALQNILFYGVILCLLLLNIGLIKTRSKRKALITSSALETDELTDLPADPVINPDYIAIQDLNNVLHLQISSLKKELMDIGEELELSYAKADRLSDQLSDIIECLDLSVELDDHTWNWSIDALNKETTLSYYGSIIHGFHGRTQLSLEDALMTVFEADRQTVAEALALSFETKVDFAAKYRMIPAESSTILWIKSTGKIVYNENGEPVSLVGKFAFTNGETTKKGKLKHH